MQTHEELAAFSVFDLAKYVFVVLSKRVPENEKARSRAPADTGKALKRTL